MDQAFIDILLATSKVAPVVAVLWLGIRFFMKRDKESQTKINELQDELRKNERDSLTVMNRLTSVLDKLIENSAADKEDILKEISLLHKDISRKLSEIKKA